MKFRDVVVAATVVDVTLVTVLRSVTVEVKALFTVTAVKVFAAAVVVISVVVVSIVVATNVVLLL